MTTVGVRSLHVAAMAVALGGAVLVALLPADGSLGRVAARYELAFWTAAGVLVMTGVGNLAAFGQGLPPPSSDWGTALVAKLGAVALLMLVSLPRALAVAGLEAPAHAAAARIRAMYAGTAALLAAVTALAVWLAHA